jgi:5-methylcytosine-specific restriction endonuclease McrA
VINTIIKGFGYTVLFQVIFTLIFAVLFPLFGDEHVGWSGGLSFGLALLVAIKSGILTRYVAGKYVSRSIDAVTWIQDTLEWDQARRVEFDARRLKRVLAPHRGFLKTLPDTLLSQHPLHFLRERQTVALFLRFVRREPSIIEDITDRSRRCRETYQLFRELVQKRLRISERSMVAGLIYVARESNYLLFRDSLQLRCPKSLHQLLHETVLFDIFRDEFTKSEDIQRYAREFRIRGSMRAGLIQTNYLAERERIKLETFEIGLQREDHDQGDIESQIRTATREQFFQNATQHDLSIKPEDYIITGPDFSRDSRVDRYYRKSFAYALSAAFNNQCSKCGEGLQQLEFDHFWIPKREGGNFAMLTRQGTYINNCIPLCRSCNASKGHRSFLDFFGVSEVDKIVEKSQSLNSIVNAGMVDFSNLQIDLSDDGPQ